MVSFKEALAEILYYVLWPFRPHTVKCCNCQAKYYLTSDLIFDYWKSRAEESQEWEKDIPLVFCPYCGVKHAIIWVKVEETSHGIKFEVY